MADCLGDSLATYSRYGDIQQLQFVCMKLALLIIGIQHLDGISGLPRLPLCNDFSPVALYNKVGHSRFSDCVI